MPIYTVALGTPDGTITLRGQTLNVPPDIDALKRIAAESGGQAFRAEDSDQLGAVYEKLGSQIGTKPEQREITALVRRRRAAAARRRARQLAAARRAPALVERRRGR